MGTAFLMTAGWELPAHIAASLAMFGSALLLSSAIRMNKGAKANRAWVSVALGLILGGISEGSRAAAHLGYLTYLEGWDGILMAAAAGFLLLGAFLWNRVVKKALR